MASRIYMLLVYIQRPLFQVTLTCCSCWLEDSCNCETFFIFFTYMIDANILLVYMFYIKICGGVSAESPWLNLFTSWLIAWFLLGIDDVLLLLLGDCYLYYWAQLRSTLMDFELSLYAGLWCYTICNRAPRRWCDYEECWCRFYCGILWVQGPPPLILSILCDAVVRKGACFRWNVLQTFYQTLRNHQICRFIMLGLNCGQIVVVALHYAHW